MKTINLNKVVIMMVISVFLLSLFTMSCGKKETTDNSQKDKQSTQMETPMNNEDQMDHKTADMNKDHAMVKVSSMQCGTCKKNIESAVEKVDGVMDVNVNLKEKIAHVNFDKSKTDITKIEGAITSAGYNANDKKADPKAYENLDDCCKKPEDQKEKSKH